MLAIPAFATPAWASDDAQAWFTVAGDIPLRGRLRLSDEVIARFSDARDGIYEVENSVMLGRKVGHRVTVWAGYTYDPQFSAGHLGETEHRIREQINVDRLLAAGPVTVSARVRVEERWRVGLSGTAWRLRPFVRLALPIGKLGGMTLNLTHETFLDLDRTAFQPRAGFERMRNALAVRAPIAKSLSLELGYLNQRGRVTGGPDQRDNVVTMSLLFTR